MMGVCPVHTVSFYCVCVCTFALSTRLSCNREKRKNKKKSLSVQMVQKATHSWLESKGLGLLFLLNGSLSNIDSSPSNSSASVFDAGDLILRGKKKKCLLRDKNVLGVTST